MWGMKYRVVGGNFLCVVWRIGRLEATFTGQLSVGVVKYRVVGVNFHGATFCVWCEILGELEATFCWV